jgi:hypothetical protein
LPARPASSRPRSVFRDLFGVYGKQAALAHAIGWPAPKVSRVLAGEQAASWDEVMEAVDRVLEDDPSSTNEIARSLARNIPGVIVEPVGEDTTPRDWGTEVVDGMTAEARLHMAVLNEDLAAFDAAAEDARRELAERIAAGRQRITGSAEGAVRLVGGAR